jgi:hypothetical protein
MVMDLQDENARLRAEKEQHQWLSAAPIRGTTSRKRTS